MEALDPVHIDPELLQKHLQSVLDAALRPGGKQYVATRCLLTCWQDDDLGCKTEVDALAVVLLDNYGIPSESYGIPSQKPQTQLSQRLLSFDTKYDDNSELLIFYYGGHGGNTADDQLELQSAGNASLRWRAIRDIIGASTADYLVIMDCCFAASSVRKPTSGLLVTGWDNLVVSGLKELLAACGWETTAVGGVQTKTSYTARLIEALCGFCEPFSVAQLHARLATIKAEDPKLLTKTPFYCPLSADKGRQITLSPLTGWVSFHHRRVKETWVCQPLP